METYLNQAASFWAMGALKFMPFIGLILFVFIIFKIGILEIIGSLSYFNFLYFILAILISVPLIFLKAFKWKLIIGSYKVNYSLLMAAAAYYISSFLGAITPGKIGEFAKMFYLRKAKGMSYGKSLSTVIADRLIDIFILLFLAFAGVVIFAGMYLISREYILVVSLFLFLVTFISILITNKRYIKFLLTPFLNKAVPLKYRSKASINFDEFYDGIRLIKEKKKILFAAIALTIISWFGTFFQHYLIALALGINLPYYFFIFVSPIIMFIEIIPVSFSGIGTRDGAAILFFSLMGMPASSAVLFSFVILVFSYIIVLPGLLLWFKHPIKI